MFTRWTDGPPPLRGDLITLREVAASDVYTLFTLFADPAVSAHMAPPPPTLAKFAGFVAWSLQERRQGRGHCGHVLVIDERAKLLFQFPQPIWIIHRVNAATARRLHNTSGPVS